MPGRDIDERTDLVRRLPALVSDPEPWARSGRGVILAGTAGVCLLGATLGLWARPDAKPPQEPPAIAAAPAGRLRIVLGEDGFAESPSPRPVAPAAAPAPEPIVLASAPLAPAAPIGPAKPDPAPGPAPRSAPAKPNTAEPETRSQDLAKARTKAEPDQAAKPAKTQFARAEPARNPKAEDRAGRKAKSAPKLLAKAEPPRPRSKPATDDKAKVKLARKERARDAQPARDGVSKAKPPPRSLAKAKDRPSRVEIAKADARPKPKTAAAKPSKPAGKPPAELDLSKLLASLDPPKSGPRPAAAPAVAPEPAPPKPKAQPKLASVPPAPPRPAARPDRTENQAAGPPRPRRPVDRCAEFRSRANGLVCADPVLAAADRRLALAYRDAAAAGVPSHTLRRRQEVWLAAREAAAYEAPWALRQVYAERIAELEDQAEAAYRATH